MAKSQQIQPFGFHQIVAYDPVTQIPYGSAEIVGSAEINRTVELINQTGGSYADPTATDTGAATSEGTLTLKEMPDWLWEVFNGQAATANAAESGGYISTLTNYNGTSVADATTGIASVAIKSGSEALLPFGQWVIEATGADTVKAYPLNSVQFYLNRVEYADDSLKINTTDFTIVASTATEIVDDNAKTLAVEMTGGSGTIGMTVGDTAIFSTRPINSGSYTASVGGLFENFKEFGLLLHSAVSTKGVMQTMQIYRCVPSGFPVSMTEKAYPEISVTIQPVADPCNNGEVYKIHTIKPNGVCA